MTNTNLFCPIRGKLKALEKSKDGLNYSEEFRRIECVNFLLKKGYPRENFDFEKNVLKYGNLGRNSLRADIIIYNKSKKEIEKDERVKNILLVAEIKRNSEEKESAIKNQLLPALNHSENSIYGIYWDDENRILLNKNIKNREHSVLKLPLFNSKWEEKFLKFKDLVKVKNSQKILKLLEQNFHNLGGTDKQFRYKEIYKILIMKYYDETKNKNSDFLEFQVFGEEEGKEEELFLRIKKLYKEAKDYYSNNSPIILEDKLEISSKILLKSLRVLEEFSFMKTNQLILQNFFMYFAPTFLKTELDQYYTPLEVVEFMSSIVELKETDCAIDTAGGSADFLTGLIKKGLNKGIENIKRNIFYWDISKDAGNVASLNMILQGDGRSNIEILDSIENFDKKNNFFQLCLTNPPFGKNTKWEKELNLMENYELGKKYLDDKKEDYELERQQLGILFIERNMNILKEGGILEIIIPNGFLTNPTLKYIREYLFNNFRIVANISLPYNLFKSSGAGGNTNILIVKKEKIEKDYKIFLDVVRNIGFEYDKKKGNLIYKRDKNTGEVLKDEENNNLLENEFLITEKKFKKFIFDENINGFESENNNITYDYVNRDEILKDKNLILCPKRFTNDYKLIKKNIKDNFITLKKIKARVQNSISFEKELSKDYIYLDTREVFTGGYKKNNILKGWELPDRAKQSVEKYDILIAKLRGSNGKFCMILEDNKNIVASNGFWRIRIENEKERLNFYSYLFTNEFEKQMEVLSTGTIMDDVKDFDIKENLLIPIANKEENYEKMKKFLEVQEELIKRS